MPRAARLALACAAALLAGCATRPEPEASWIGAGYGEVAERWGRPHLSETLPDGLEARTWAWERTSWRPVMPSLSVGISGGSGMGLGIGVGLGLPSGGGSSSLERCERTLFFRDGVVVDERRSGPARCAPARGSG